MVNLMTIRDKNVKSVFMKVFASFALKQLSLDPTPLYETGFFDASSVNLLSAAYKQTLIDLRPDMISLVELLPEGALCSTIGNKYGDIYEAQFETAKASRLNKGEVP